MAAHLYMHMHGLASCGLWSLALVLLGIDKCYWTGAPTVTDLFSCYCQRAAPNQEKHLGYRSILCTVGASKVLESLHHR